MYETLNYFEKPTHHPIKLGVLICIIFRALKERSLCPVKAPNWARAIPISQGMRDTALLLEETIERTLDRFNDQHLETRTFKMGTEIDEALQKFSLPSHQKEIPTKDGKGTRMAEVLADNIHFQMSPVIFKDSQDMDLFISEVQSAYEEHPFLDAIIRSVPNIIVIRECPIVTTTGNNHQFKLKHIGRVGSTVVVEQGSLDQHLGLLNTLSELNLIRNPCLNPNLSDTQLELTTKELRHENGGKVHLTRKMHHWRNSWMQPARKATVMIEKGKYKKFRLDQFLNLRTPIVETEDQQDYTQKAKLLTKEEQKSIRAKYLTKHKKIVR